MVLIAKVIVTTYFNFLSLIFNNSKICHPLKDWYTDMELFGEFPKIFLTLNLLKNKEIFFHFRAFITLQL